jgi:hypothetical protein
MNRRPEVTYALESGIGEQRGRKEKAVSIPSEPAAGSIPRIARLLALAIRLDGLIREQRIANYAEAACRGRVTRARMTQIMKLLDLAPDIQEQILFFPPLPGLNERNLRPIAKLIDWAEQRRLFQELTGCCSAKDSLG